MIYEHVNNCKILIRHLAILIQSRVKLKYINLCMYIVIYQYIYTQTTSEKTDRYIGNWKQWPSVWYFSILFHNRFIYLFHFLSSLFLYIFFLSRLQTFDLEPPSAHIFIGEWVQPTLKGFILFFTFIITEIFHIKRSIEVVYKLLIFIVSKTKQVDWLVVEQSHCSIHQSIKQLLYCSNGQIIYLSL